MSLDYLVIGRRVKELRLQKGFSQEALAEQIDMSVSYISRIETAKKQASLEALVRIANVLGVTMDHLLNGNQKSDTVECFFDMARLMEGCSNFEKKIICDVALAAKRSLFVNRDQ